VGMRFQPCGKAALFGVCHNWAAYLALWVLSRLRWVGDVSGLA